MATMVLVEGIGRFVRDSQLAPLMMQRAARFSLVLRQLLLVLSLAAMALLDLHSAQVLFFAECMAAAVATTVALSALLGRLGGPGEVGYDAVGLNGTHGQVQYGVALKMYGAHLLALSYSPLVLLHVLQRAAGAETAALFGFLRLIHDQIARYLPAMLLFSLIHPKLMAGFVQSGFGELNRNAVLSGKLSLFVLCPIIAFVAVTGDPLVGLLSSNRFEGAGLVLLGFVIALVPYSQRQLLESVAVAANLSRLCVVASAASAVALPLVFVLWPSPFGTTAALACMILGHGIFDVVLARALSVRAGYRGDSAGWGKLITATAIAGGAGWLCSLGVAGWASSATTAGAISVGVFFVTAWAIKPFSAEERGRINGLARRKVFFG